MFDLLEAKVTVALAAIEPAPVAAEPPARPLPLLPPLPAHLRDDAASSYVSFDPREPIPDVTVVGGKRVKAVR